MDYALFLSFIAATFVIVATPGPACALASSLAVRYGPKAAVASICGDALGTVVHIVVAVISLQALLSLASQILPVLQIAGGCFILYLAYTSFTAAKTESAALPVGGYRTAFVSGFFSCVTNPKAIVFFAALFPGFINPELGVVFQSLIYGAVFVLLDAASIFGYAMLALSASRSRFGERFNVERLSAFGLLGVGLLLIFKGYRELRPS
ncbi:LysE family translocator [uncultured Litoreibacter sp.]|uniref:LysE family translocator n=1 Tax=uncultured Litoreibacter sp. TaxID=1392394 RepID=UPI002613E558|nr:LysE family translocator [uncultured Litoreibacter sp.]